MSLTRRFNRIGQAALLSAAFLSVGCSYLKDRGNDFADMFAIGVTVSSKPTASLYVSFFSAVTLGWSNFEGTFIGWCQREGGVVPARQKAGGVVLWAYEQVGYGDEFKMDDPKSPAEWNAGLVGLFGENTPPASYTATCNKWVHVGFIGVTANCKWSQIFDFLVGLTTVDVLGDDTFSKGSGRAPAPEKPAAKAPAE
ncbi:MAG: hypothetical protein AAB215_01705 [Planctomycetota bacterium]